MTTAIAGVVVSAVPASRSSPGRAGGVFTGVRSHRPDESDDDCHRGPDRGDRLPSRPLEGVTRLALGAHPHAAVEVSRGNLRPALPAASDEVGGTHARVWPHDGTRASDAGRDRAEPANGGGGRVRIGPRTRSVTRSPRSSSTFRSWSERRCGDRCPKRARASRRAVAARRGATRTCGSRRAPPWSRTFGGPRRVSLAEVLGSALDAARRNSNAARSR